MKKKLQLVSVLFLLLTSVLSAQDFTVGNFKYAVLSGTDVSLTGYVTKPTGSLTISGTVTNASIIYNVTTIGTYAFSGCSGLTALSIPSSVTSIIQGAFYSCSGLTTLSIPSSVTSIAAGAFSGCSGLTTLSIPSSITSIENSAFRGCSGLTTLSIPSSVISIGAYAFYGCSGLTTLSIPSSVTSIGERAFFYCIGLTELIIPSSVTSIGDSAFSACPGLTTLSIPSSVTSIGPYAFSSCTGLKSVNVSWATPLAITSTVFGNVSLNTVDLNVPTGTTALYQAAQVWKDFKFPTLSNNDFFGNIKVILYPNPVKESLTISGLDQKENYSIYSLSGAKISTGSVDTVNQKIDTQNLANGTYLIQLGQGSSSKFVKQ